jgi:hypothetical protein
VRHRLVLTHPELWPYWPFLPLVRRDAEGQTLGVLFDARGVCGLTGYSATVYLTCLFTLPSTLEAFLALPREVFDTTDELVERGWRID